MLVPNQAYPFFVLSPHLISLRLFVVTFLYLMHLNLPSDNIAKQQHEH